ncbi:hypothetical protein, partial [Alloalcanivorax dieselolei]|uniref:hypothetical protein n=1 Tax=Alloalcanivorax dieselolei TaxID=285091 RepID=UPI001E3C634C
NGLAFERVTKPTLAAKLHTPSSLMKVSTFLGPVQTKQGLKITRFCSSVFSFRCQLSTVNYPLSTFLPPIAIFRKTRRFAAA